MDTVTEYIRWARDAFGAELFIMVCVMTVTWVHRKLSVKKFSKKHEAIFFIVGVLLGTVALSVAKYDFKSALQTTNSQIKPDLHCSIQSAGIGRTSVVLQ
jgi:hypothetical protein